MLCGLLRRCLLICYSDVQHRGRVDVLRVHHARDPLQRGNDHGLLPIVERGEPFTEDILKWGRGLQDHLLALVRQGGVDDPLILGAAMTQD